MTRVKIISDWDKHTVEVETNAFITSHNVVSMQFQMAGTNTSGKTYAVMIIYEE